MSNGVLSWLVGTVWLVTASSPLAQGEKPGDKSARFELVEKLAAKVNYPGLDDTKATLQEQLESLTRKHGVVFHVNEKAFKFDNVFDVLNTLIADPNPIPKKTAPLSHVLTSVLARIPAPTTAVFVVRDTHVEITTGRSLLAEFGTRRSYRPDLLNSSFDVKQYLPPLINVAIKNLALPAAFAEIARAGEGNVLLDPRAVKEGKAPRVSTVFRNVPLDTAVRLVADLADAKIVQIDNVYYVTTPENAVLVQKEQDDRNRKRAWRR